MDTYYERLGISKTASDGEIKKAFRSLSIKYHPDKNIGQDTNHIFSQISEAYLAIVDHRSRFPTKSDKPHESKQEATKDSHCVSIPVISKTVEVSLVDAYNGTQMPISIERDKYAIDNISSSILVSKELVTIYLDIPPGIDNDELITLSGQGHVNKDNEKGDVIVRIKIINNTMFRREGLILKLSYDISLKESLLGCNLKFEHLNGKNINIRSSSIIHPNMEKRIQNMGMKRGNRVGDLMITFNVLFPTYLSREQIEALQDIL